VGKASELAAGRSSLAFSWARRAFSSRLSPKAPVVNAHVLRKPRRFKFSELISSP